MLTWVTGALVVCDLNSPVFGLKLRIVFPVRASQSPERFQIISGAGAGSNVHVLLCDETPWKPRPSCRITLRPLTHIPS